MARSRQPKRASQRANRATAAPSATAARDVYSEMLSEAGAAPSSDDNIAPPLKRRRVETHVRSTSKPRSTIHSDDALDTSQRQVVYDDSHSDMSSDVDWEDVALQHGHTTDEEPTLADIAGAKDLTIHMGGEQSDSRKKKQAKKASMSATDKKARLVIHKLHLCCLIAHVCIRNQWCNDPEVQAALRPLLGKRAISYLNPNPEFSQFQQDRSFRDGLQQASDIFKPHYKIVYRSFRRARWASEFGAVQKPQQADHLEPLVTKEDFLKLSRRREGSRDAGAQLFCAMLRSAGVDARLVCSLQPLSFASVPSTTASTLKPPARKATVVYTSESDRHQDTEYESTSPATARSQTGSATETSPATVPRVRRFGQTSTHDQALDLGKAPPVPVKPPKLAESHYPVFWIEAFNIAKQDWIPVDPLVTNTIDRPQKLEPPASDALNDMTYVIAFEADGSMKDVTRRYAKAYNAKTRRARIESTKGGVLWWKRALRIFRGSCKDRDQVEDAKLSKKEVAEPMPRNVQDYKDHPYYALERHTRHNEVIFPKREVGKVSVGKGTDAVEPIYRRGDVLMVRTADKWFRLTGREVKPGDQPLKYATPRRARRQRSLSATSEDRNAEADTAESAGAALYAEHQTQLYLPPVVSQGQVPKNAFGNLDLYVPSMIPPGGVHVRAAEAAKAAQVLGIAYADAVTGFEFRGRRGTAIVNGVVVAKESAQAMKEVIQGLKLEKETDALKKRSVIVLKLWKRFMTGLVVRERIMGYAGNDEANDMDIQARVDEAEDGESKVIEEGGFMPDVDQAAPQPTAGHEAGEANTNFGDVQTGFAALTMPHIPNDNPPQNKHNELELCIFSPWDSPGPLADQYIARRGPKLELAEELGREPTSEDVHHGPNSARAMIDIAAERMESGGSEGGGFLPDDLDEDQGVGTVDAEVEDNSGGGFLVDEEEDAIHVGANTGTQHTSVVKSAADESDVMADEKLYPNRERASVDAHSVSHEEEKDQEEDEDESVANDENGQRSREREGRVTPESLLSEDPEDLDAEPEWLQ